MRLSFGSPAVTHRNNTRGGGDQNPKTNMKSAKPKTKRPARASEFGKGPQRHFLEKDLSGPDKRPYEVTGVLSEDCYGQSLRVLKFSKT